MKKIYVILGIGCFLIVIMVRVKYRDGLEYFTPVLQFLCAVNLSCNERFDKCMYIPIKMFCLSFKFANNENTRKNF